MAPAVSSPAPKFEAEALMPDGTFDIVKLSEYFAKKWVLLFFYPFDFTFVCPSEILAFNEAVEDFALKDVQVIGCSIDSKYAHQAWTNVPVEKGGVGKIKFPLLADVKKEIASQYGVLHQDGMALRGIFLIDPSGILQTYTVNNLFLGRSVDEAMRLVDACQHFEKFGHVCPANWKKGKKAMTATADGVAQYLAETYKN